MLLWLTGCRLSYCLDCVSVEASWYPRWALPHVSLAFCPLLRLVKQPVWGFLTSLRYTVKKNRFIITLSSVLHWRSPAHLWRLLLMRDFRLLTTIADHVHTCINIFNWIKLTIHTTESSACRQKISEVHDVVKSQNKLWRRIDRRKPSVYFAGSFSREFWANAYMMPSDTY